MDRGCTCPHGEMFHREAELGLPLIICRMGITMRASSKGSRESDVRWKTKSTYWTRHIVPSSTGS